MTQEIFEKAKKLFGKADGLRSAISLMKEVRDACNEITNENTRLNTQGLVGDGTITIALGTKKVSITTSNENIAIICTMLHQSADAQTERFATSIDMIEEQIKLL